MMKPAFLNPDDDAAIAGAAREAQAYRSAATHSRRVRILKRVLPLAGLLIVVAVVGGIFIGRQAGPNFTLSDVVLSGEALTMASPKLSGFDNDHHPYEVSARRATQALATPELVDLEGVDARLVVNDQGWVRINAEHGRFNTENRFLTLSGGIEVKSSDGYVLGLDAADIDMPSGRLDSSSAVVIDGPTLHLEAGSLLVENKGERVVFRGPVRMTIQPEAPSSGGQ